ncbi:MAG TPA: hypothetical protein VF590_01210 [Isosphaeraceae bacterium]
MDDLSPAGRAYLRYLLRFRDRPPTVRGQFWANRRRYLVLLGVLALTAGILYLAAGPTGAGYAGVATAAALARDAGMFRRVAVVWPVTREVIDWAEVERLVAAADP